MAQSTPEVIAIAQTSIQKASVEVAKISAAGALDRHDALKEAARELVFALAAIDEICAREGVKV